MTLDIWTWLWKTSQFFFLLNQNFNLSRKHNRLNWLSSSAVNLFSIINHKSRFYNLSCLNLVRGRWNQVWQLHGVETLTRGVPTEWVLLHHRKRHCNRICRMSFVFLWPGPAKPVSKPDSIVTLSLIFLSFGIRETVYHRLNVFTWIHFSDWRSSVTRRCGILVAQQKIPLEK